MRSASSVSPSSSRRSGLLAGVGALIGTLRGSGRRLLALALLGLLVLLPTSLPHAISGVQLALKDLEADVLGPSLPGPRLFRRRGCG